MSCRFALCTMLLAGSFPAIEAQSTLNFPRLSLETGTVTGVAIVNPSSTQAEVTIVAYGKDGGELARSEGHVIGPGAQFSKLASELFPGLPPSAEGWFQATSEQSGLTGFFLFLTTDLAKLDGADLPVIGTDIVFNQVRVDSGHSTEINIINPGSAPATVTLRLFGAGGSPVASEAMLAAKGMCRLDAETFFDVSQLSEGAYIRATSAVPVAGFQLVQSAGGDILGLNAKRADEKLNTLYFPQLAVLGGLKMELGVVNYSESPAIVTAWAMREGGTPFGPPDLSGAVNNPVVMPLEAGSSLRLDVEQLFGFQGANTLDGWIKVEATSEAINGYVTYGVPRFGSSAAVSSVALRRTCEDIPSGSNRPCGTRQLFSHIATVEGFFTGVAVLNPSTLAANLRIVALSKQGNVLGKFDTVLQPGQRISRLLTEYLGDAARNQNGGLIWIRSSLPVYSTAIFGPFSRASLANVPPQPSPAGYEPDAVLPLAGVTPPFWTLHPGQAHPFLADGAGTAPSWSVNAQPGGGAQTGTVTMDGLYTAPDAIPSPPVVTIRAEGESSTAGASVDVLGRETVISNLERPVEAVAYLGSLQRLYTAELATLSASAKISSAGSTRIVETDVTSFPNLTSRELAFLEGDAVSDMISFITADNRSFLLLASRNKGIVIRLDPRHPAEQIVLANGLIEPQAMVIDPLTGHLLVAERSQISEIDGSLLEAQGAGPPAEARRLVTAEAAAGIAVDGTTGKIYYSDPTNGQILAIDRILQEPEIVAQGLASPGQLLGLHRAGVSGPGSFQVLAVEEDEDRVSLIIPSYDLVVAPWVQSMGTKDLALLPSQTPLAEGRGVLLGEAPAPNEGQVSLVATGDLYAAQALNPSTSRGEVILEDPNLEIAIREALSIGFDEPLTIELAESLTVLEARFSGIVSLSGLDSFRSLSVIVLDFNQISDISALTSMTDLTELRLESNQISDISALAGLTNLTNLSLAGNQISDIGALAGLTDLTELRLELNQISDIGALAGLTNLTNLSLAGNQISDIGALAGLTNLTFLGLFFNQITNIGALSGLTNLTVVDLGKNQISDLNALAISTNLTHLYLGSNQISNIGDLAGLTNLTFLTLSSNQISDISALAGLTNLTSLILASNYFISDISALAGLTNLTELYLQGNQISDISALVGLTDLRCLDLTSNLILDISPLAGLTNLTELALNSQDSPISGISDVSPLAGLTNLACLELAFNQISNIDALAALTNLTTLNLNFNEISSFNALAGLTSLTTLSLNSNEISNIDALAGLTNLTTLNLNFNEISNIDALAGLTNLTTLDLYYNQISDIGPLVSNVGLGEGDTVSIRSNLLDLCSCTNIRSLIARGVEVFHDVPCG